MKKKPKYSLLYHITAMFITNIHLIFDIRETSYFDYVTSCSPSVSLKETCFSK